MAMILIPAVTTGSILIFGFISKQVYLIFLGVIVTIGAMATPFLMHSAAQRAAKKRNELRRQRYGELLDHVNSEIEHAKATVRDSLQMAHPSLARLSQWFQGGHLWERRASDSDFLSIMLGVGDIASGLTVSVGKNTALEAQVFEDLRERAEQIERAAAKLDEAPLCLPLREHAVISVEGERGQALALVRAMLIEAVVCCGPDEMSLLVTTRPELERDWTWAGSVPHALHRSDASHEISPIGTSPKELSTALTRVIAPRVQLLAEGKQRIGRTGIGHLIIVLDDFHPGSELAEVPLLQQTLTQADDLAVTVITIPERPGASPSEATAVVTVATDQPGTLRLTRTPDASRPFTPSLASAASAERVADAISYLELVTELSFGGDSANDLLLDLLGRRPLPASAPDWPPLSPTDLLTATFGVQADGRPFRLDLKEGAVDGDGPHGLLVGATGSGKSELLRSMVTSLALTHNPEWLQMAFVDFKGGSAFELLAGLPHCVGLITNILDDLSLIERMRSALTGELLARQRQLATAGDDLQGIRDYWKLRASNPSLPPMPYLLVVIDEFAELLDADPDFLELLLKVGRQGRSLGVHLVLSSQRLEAGRIRGLESYLSYRIALRTFNADESSAAIGSKAAAELPPMAGHGYFKAADAFQRFKSSQVSADGEGTRSVSDLARVVSWFSGYPQSEPLWLRPLPNSANEELLTLDDERLGTSTGSGSKVHPAAAGLPVVVGLLDEPERRRQFPAAFDLARADGHLAIIGAPQTGKSSAMVTQVLQAAREYPATLLRFFILDFGGGSLTTIRALPNVGACATPQDPDRVARVLAEMVTLLDERAREFQRNGITSMAHQRLAASRGTGQAHTVLLIDNYAAFKERYPEQEPAVERVLVEGANFGLHVHLASARWADVGARRLDQISNRIELRLNDPSDSLYGRAKAAAIRTAGPGRGLAPPGLQLQFAAPILTTGGALEASAATVAEHARRSWNGQRTPPLLLLDDLTTDDFQAALAMVPAGSVMLGVNESGFGPFLFEPGRSGNLLLTGDLDSGRTAGLARILTIPGPHGPIGEEADVYAIDFRGDLLAALGPEAKVMATASSPSEGVTLVAKLKQELDARMDGAVSPAEVRQPILLVVDDFELVQALAPGSGMNQTLLGSVSPHLLVSQRLSFSAVVCQLAANSSMRATDPFLKRVLESGAWRMFFSVASRSEALPGSHRGRPLPPGCADVIRPGHPAAHIQSLRPM